MRGVSLPRAMLMTGVLYVALMAVGFAMGQHPAPGAPLDEIAGFVDEQRAGFLATTYLTCLSQAVLLWFVSGLRVLLGRVEGGDRPLARVAFASGVASAVALFMSSAFAAALVVRPADPARGELALVFFDLFTLGFALAALFLASFLLAASLVLLGRGLSPALGWLGLLAAAVQFISSFVAFYGPAGVGVPAALGEAVDTAADFLLIAWLVLASIVLSRRRTWERLGVERVDAVGQAVS